MVSSWSQNSQKSVRNLNFTMVFRDGKLLISVVFGHLGERWKRLIFFLFLSVLK